MVPRFWLKSFCCLAVLCGASVPGIAADPIRPTAEEIATLIERLGHDEFAEREQAGERLLKVGLPAYKQVEAAIDHKDREIRYRAARILAQIREADLNRRLEEFIQGKEDPSSFPIPGWAAFKKAVTDSVEIRQIYVEMQKAEPELFDTLENNPKELNDLIAQRVMAIQQAMQFQQQQLKLGQVLAFVFVGTEAKGLQQQTANMIQSFCYQQSFRDAITAGAKRDVCRKLLGYWIRQGEDTAAYQGMMLAMQYELDDGLVPAVKILEAANRQPHFSMYAAIAIAKFGKEKERAILEKLLDDKNVVNQMQVNNKLIKTQMSDVALACLLHMTKQDHKTYGFDRLQPVAPYLFNVGTLGFDDDEKRKTALTKWQEFKTKEAKEKGTQPPANAPTPANAPAPAANPTPAPPGEPKK